MHQPESMIGNDLRLEQGSPHDTEPFAALSAGVVDADGATHAGAARSSNEDGFFVASLSRALQLQRSSSTVPDGRIWDSADQGRLLAVADGISGHGGGDLASTVALAALADFTTHALPSGPVADDGSAVLATLSAAVEHCQARVRAAAADAGMAGEPVGTTLTFGYVFDRRLHLVHVGDSRCYLLRSGTLYRLTRDHTLAERLIERHVLAPENAESTPFRNILVNAVGGSDDEIEPEEHIFELAPGDTLLLCTDGLTNAISDDDIAAILQGGGSCASACDALIEAALARGASDNVTAVVAAIGVGRL